MLPIQQTTGFMKYNRIIYINQRCSWVLKELFSIFYIHKVIDNIGTTPCCFFVEF